MWLTILVGLFCGLIGTYIGHRLTVAYDRSREEAASASLQDRAQLERAAVEATLGEVQTGVGIRGCSSKSVAAARVCTCSSSPNSTTRERPSSSATWAESDAADDSATL